MPAPKNLPYQPAFFWISVSAILLTCIYWIFTLGMVFFPKSLNSKMPAAHNVYQAFLNQDWQLFAATHTYYRELKLVLHKEADSAIADTLLLVDNILQEKRSGAPFINYPDAIDRMVERDVNRLEAQIYHYKRKQRLPVQISTDRFDSLVAASPEAAQSLLNLERYSRFMADRLKRLDGSRGFQLILVHEPIRLPGSGMQIDNGSATIFTTAYKNW